MKGGKDLSDYSRAEVREIAKYFQIEEPAMSDKYNKYADLREKINAGLDAQLGVTGDTLLQALQPKENK